MGEGNFANNADDYATSVLWLSVGLVDAHTHAVWAGDRVHEFAMKVRSTSLTF